MRIGRVAMKTAADLIVDAAVRHFGQRVHDHVFVAVAVLHQKIERHRRRKFRRAAETAILRVVALCDRSCSAIEPVLLNRSRPFRLQLRVDDLADFVRSGLHIGTARPIGIEDVHENALESRHSVAIVGREVRAGVKRSAVRRQKNRHRPAAVPGHQLHGLHVNRVDIRPFFAIDFNGHEMVVEDLRELIVLERLALHHVAPVTRRISDRKKHGLVFAARFSERFFAPRKPIDRVVRVLKKVWRCFFRQPVRHVRSSRFAVRSWFSANREPPSANYARG